MADAFGATFWWATGLLVVAFAASLLLPKTRPELASAGAGAPEGAEPGEAAPLPIPA
jgi:hypothetical protein